MMRKFLVFGILCWGIISICGLEKRKLPFVQASTYNTSSKEQSDSNISVIAGTTLTIREKYNGKKVTSVSLPITVCNNSKVKKLVLPSGLKRIMSEDIYEAIYDSTSWFASITPNCPNLANVTVSSKNQYFKTIDGILYSKDGTYLYYCPPGKTGSVVIPKGVERIGVMAFQDCAKITTITLPATLKYIGDGAFGGNTKLKSIKLASENESFQVIDNVLFSKDGSCLYVYPGGKTEKQYTIPEGVVEIRPTAFRGNTKLQILKSSAGLGIVGKVALENCSNLEEVVFSAGLQEIGGVAFRYCKKLTTLILPEGTVNIWSGALDGCDKLKELIFPASVIQIPSGLGTVKGRVIKLYNPYVTCSLVQEGSISEGVVVYAYKGSATAIALQKQGATVEYFNEAYAETYKPLDVPEGVVKGTGKADISWYTTEEKKFEISNPDQLAGVALLVQQGKDLEGVTIELVKDLDLSCYDSWIPIGMYGENETSYWCKANFEGNSHIIYNLRIERPIWNEVGLFGMMSGNINNVVVQGAHVIGGCDVGILVGFMMGTVENCTVSGSVNGKIGASYADDRIIQNCFNYASVEGSSSIGGMIGNMAGSGELYQATNIGEVTGIKAVGGIRGTISWDGFVNDCKNKGVVNGNYHVGGIVGSSLIGTVKKTSNSGKVNGMIYVGGIIGICESQYNEGEKVISCTNTGEVTGNTYMSNEIGKDFVVIE